MDEENDQSFDQFEPPNKKGWKWAVLYGFAGAIDGIQFFFPVIGDVLDIPTPIILAGLLAAFGIITWGYFFSIIAFGGIDAITGGILPAWVADIAFIHWMTTRKGITRELANMALKTKVPGVRPPSSAPPLNQEGVRLPQK